MSRLKLTILSPERRLLDGVEVDEVTLPGSEGQIQILPEHAPMIGTVEVGIFNYRDSSGQEHSGVLSEGFFEVNANRVTLMAESLDLKGEINVELAKQAQKEAEDALKAADLDEHQFKRYQLKLQHALVSQQLASKEHA